MTDRASENLGLLRRCFDRIAEGDADGVVELYTDDYLLELPYGSLEETVRIEGRETVRGYLVKTFSVLRFAVTIDTVHPTADADLVIAEYTSEGKAVASGRRYANRYVGFWWFRDGRICRTREYLNPQAVEATGLEPADFR